MLRSGYFFRISILFFRISTAPLPRLLLSNPKSTGEVLNPASWSCSSVSVPLAEAMDVEAGVVTTGSSPLGTFGDTLLTIWLHTITGARQESQSTIILADTV